MWLPLKNCHFWGILTLFDTSNTSEIEKSWPPPGAGVLKLILNTSKAKLNDKNPRITPCDLLRMVHYGEKHSSGRTSLKLFFLFFFSSPKLKYMNNKQHKHFFQSFFCLERNKYCTTFTILNLHSFTQWTFLFAGKQI